MHTLSPLLLTLSLTAGADLQTLSGKKLTGDLVGLDRQTLILRTAAGDVRHPVTDVLQIDLPTPELGHKGGWYDVELTDGSLLHCSEVALKGKLAELTLLPDVRVTVPLTAVFTILRDAHDPKVKAEFQQFLGQRGRYDTVVVRSEGRLNGLEGTFGDGTEAGDGIAFTLTGGDTKVTPKLAKVVGFVFVQKPDPAAPPVLCKVGDSARNLLVAADVTLNDKGLTVTTVAGVKVELPGAARLTRLDFSKGKLTYLSDMVPSFVDESSTEDSVFHFRRDTNLDGGPLRLGVEMYPKGLAVHSRTVLSYDIGGDYREFRTVLGVDESVLTYSRVVVLVEGDGRELYKGEIGRKDAPRPVAVDIKGVQKLRVTVRSAGLLDLGAQVNLADAKVSK